MSRNDFDLFERCLTLGGTIPGDPNDSEENNINDDGVSTSSNINKDPTDVSGPEVASSDSAGDSSAESTEAPSPKRTGAKQTGAKRAKQTGAKRGGKKQKEARPVDPALLEIFELMNLKFVELWNPGKFISVDEMGIPYKGRFVLRQYNGSTKLLTIISLHCRRTNDLYGPGKPHKYHIKGFGAADENGYLLWFKPLITGEHPPAKDVVDQVQATLAKCGIPGDHSMLITDSFYGSVETAQSLHQQFVLFFATESILTY